MWSWIGAFFGVSLISYLSYNKGIELLIPPFGATCALLFGMPSNPLAQPRNVIGGYFISSFIGIMLGNLCGATWWVYGLAVATALVAMELTDTLHPPAAADPILLIMADEISLRFLISPILIGSLFLVLTAIIFNNACNKRSYPLRWW